MYWLQLREGYAALVCPSTNSPKSSSFTSVAGAVQTRSPTWSVAAIARPLLLLESLCCSKTWRYTSSSMLWNGYCSVVAAVSKKASVAPSVLFPETHKEHQDSPHIELEVGTVLEPKGVFCCAVCKAGHTGPAVAHGKLYSRHAKEVATVCKWIHCHGCCKKARCCLHTDIRTGIGVNEAIVIDSVLLAVV